MTTDLSQFQIEIDQTVSVTMTFDLTASGSPENGWELADAVLLETTIWLDARQAEESTVVCADRTEWLKAHLKADAVDRRRFEEALDEQYAKDHEDDDVYASHSWRQAVALGCD